MHFGLSAEVSDQNFEDEDQGEMSSRASMVKRLKTASVDATNNDQVMILKKMFLQFGLSHISLRSCVCCWLVIIWSLTFVHSLMCSFRLCLLESFVWQMFQQSIMLHQRGIKKEPMNCCQSTLRALSAPNLICIIVWKGAELWLGIWSLIDSYWQWYTKRKVN